MDKKNDVSFTVVVLNCIVAVLWNAGVCIDLVHEAPNAFRIVLAIVWNIIAVTWIVRYLKSKKSV